MLLDEQKMTLINLMNVYRSHIHKCAGENKSTTRVHIAPESAKQYLVVDLLNSGHRGQINVDRHT